MRPFILPFNFFLNFSIIAAFCCVFEELQYFSFGFQFQSEVNFSEYKTKFAAKMEKPIEFKCKPSR